MSRTFPHSLEAERALLGGLLQAPDELLRIADRLKVDDFYRPDHAALFELLVEMQGRQETVDLVTLPRRLDAQGQAERYGGVAYVMELVTYAPTTANLDHYAETIRELHVRRKIIVASESLQRKASTHEDASRVLIEESIKELAALGAGSRSDTWGEISLIIDDEIKKIEALEQVDGSVVGVRTGFRALDEKLTGLRPGQLIILAARPGMGKTALALNMAQNAALGDEAGENKVGVGLFSLEMTRGELVGRMLVSLALVDSKRVRTGNLSQEDWTALMDTAYELRGTSVFIDDTPALPIGDLRARARKLKADHPELGLIVIDYLQLMRGDDARAPRIQQVGDISRGLKALAKDLELPVVALSQLNRGVESRQDKRPMLSDLRESGAIEQDADVILFIYRDDYYNPDSTEPGVAEVIIAKQRAGSTGSVKLAFQGQYTRFDDLGGDGPLV